MASTMSLARQHIAVPPVGSSCGCNLQKKKSVAVPKAFCGLRKVESTGSRGIKLRTGTSRVVCAVGDVSPEGTTYLIAGAVAVALLGTAYPLLFSRKDLCPECDGAGFIRKTGSALKANAARKDSAQIVCPTCNGLGKLGQVDK